MIEGRCDELVRQGQFLSAGALFVRADGTHVARYRFTHSLYPHAIAERVPAGLRLRLHQRVGEWLERTYGARVTAIAGPLAWHFEEAGDYRRAIRYLVIAAENAAERFAYGDASRVLQHARSLLQHLAADAPSALEVELLQRIGDAHYGRGAWVECAEAYEAAATRAADAGSTSTQVHALRGLIRPYAVLDPDRGIAAIEQAVRLSATLDDPLLHARTELLAAGIRLTYDAWRTEDWERCAAASETIHRLSDAGPPAFDRVIYAHLQVLRGEYAKALENLEGIPKEDDSTSIMVPMFALSGKMLALLYAGRLGELVQMLRAGRDTAEANGNEPWLFVSREAWLRTAVLDFAGARALCGDSGKRRRIRARTITEHRWDRQRVCRPGARRIRRRVAELHRAARSEEGPEVLPPLVLAHECPARVERRVAGFRKPPQGACRSRPLSRVRPVDRRAQSAGAGVGRGGTGCDGRRGLDGCRGEDREGARGRAGV